MPVNLGTLAGIPYTVQQAIIRLGQAVDSLETRPAQDAALVAALRAEQSRQAAVIQTLIQQIEASRADRRAQESAGGGGGGATGLDVPLANLSAIVVAYADANPAQLLNSCLAQGGNWDFMDGCVAALMAADPRVGWCGQRGDPNDAAEDAVCYWGKSTMPPVNGETGNYVVDIIANHCPVSVPASPMWGSVAPAGAVWLAARP